MSARLSGAKGLRDIVGAAVPTVFLLACSAGASASNGIGSDRIQIDETRSLPEVTSEPFRVIDPEHRGTESGAIKSAVTEGDVETASGPASPAALTEGRLLDEIFGEEETPDQALPGDEPEQKPIALPPTATRLPGVATEELPRFRRQMYRLDI